MVYGRSVPWRNEWLFSAVFERVPHHVNNLNSAKKTDCSRVVFFLEAGLFQKAIIWKGIALMARQNRLGASISTIRYDTIR